MASITTTKRFKAGKSTTADQVLQGLDLTGKVAVVTGGNSGIGLETCRALALKGARVHLCARDRELGEKAISDIKSNTPAGAPVPQLLLQPLDLSDLVSVRRAAGALLAAEPGGIHMLILNAGVMACPLMRTKQGLELQMGVNHVGHMLLTQLLLPALTTHGSPARVVAVSSMAHAYDRGFEAGLDDLGWRTRPERGYDPWVAYGNSKLANVLFARELANRLKGTQVNAFSLHPGIIFTNLQRHTPWLLRAALKLLLPFAKSPQQGAATSVFAATAPELDDPSVERGAYLADCGLAGGSCSARGRDAELARKLWEATEKLLRELERTEEDAGESTAEATTEATAEATAGAAAKAAAA